MPTYEPQRMVDHLASLRVCVDEDGRVRRRSSIQLNPPSIEDEPTCGESKDGGSIDKYSGGGDHSSVDSGVSDAEPSADSRGPAASPCIALLHGPLRSLGLAAAAARLRATLAVSQRLRQLTRRLDEPLVITSRTQDFAHVMGFTTVLLCLAVIGILIIYRDETMLAKITEEHSTVPTLHATMAIAFLFAVALNWLSATHAVSLERRTLSTVLSYVSAVACMVYAAMAALPLRVGESHSGHPVYFLRYVEWLLTCPAMLFFAALAARQKLREGLANLACDMVVISCGLVGQFLSPTFSIVAGIIAMLCYVVLMHTLFTAFGRGKLKL